MHAVLKSEQTEVKYILKFATCHCCWQYVTLTHDFNKYEKSGLDYSQIHSYVVSKQMKLDALGINWEAALKIPLETKLWVQFCCLEQVVSDLVHSRPFLVTGLKLLIVSASLYKQPCHLHLVPWDPKPGSWEPVIARGPCTCGCLSNVLTPLTALVRHEVAHETISARSAR